MGAFVRLATFEEMPPPSRPVKPVRPGSPVAAAPVRLGQRNTRPRAAIIAILESAKGPLTVAEIHALAQKFEPSATIGIATVYRTLGLLVDNKLAQPVVLPSGETRYESSGHKGHHDHFQCLNCTRVFDIDTCQLGLPANVLIAGGFRVQGHELMLRGLCPDCDGGPSPSRRKRQS